MEPKNKIPVLSLPLPFHNPKSVAHNWSTIREVHGSHRPEACRSKQDDRTLSLVYRCLLHPGPFIYSGEGPSGQLDDGYRHHGFHWTRLGKVRTLVLFTDLIEMSDFVINSQWFLMVRMFDAPGIYFPISKCLMPPALVAQNLSVWCPRHWFPNF